MEKLIINKIILKNARELTRAQIRQVMGGGGAFTTLSQRCPACNNPMVCIHPECLDCVTQDIHHNPVGACIDNS